MATQDTKILWPCELYMTATMPGGKQREIKFVYDGIGDIICHAIKILDKRLRKPFLWYGVGFTITTPLGQKINAEYPWPNDRETLNG